MDLTAKGGWPQRNLYDSACNDTPNPLSIAQTAEGGNGGWLHTTGGSLAQKAIWTPISDVVLELCWRAGSHYAMVGAMAGLTIKLPAPPPPLRRFLYSLAHRALGGPHPCIMYLRQPCCLFRFSILLCGVSINSARHGWAVPSLLDATPPPSRSGPKAPRGGGGGGGGFFGGGG